MNHCKPYGDYFLQTDFPLPILIATSSRTAILYFFISIRPVVIHSSVCQGLTLAFAPRSIAKSKSEDGNLSFMVLTKPSGSLAFLSSSSKTTK